jgi:hypothetical protein
MKGQKQRRRGRYGEGDYELEEKYDLLQWALIQTNPATRKSDTVRHPI